MSAKKETVVNSQEQGSPSPASPGLGLFASKRLASGKRKSSKESKRRDSESGSTVQSMEELRGMMKEGEQQQQPTRQGLWSSFQRGDQDEVVEMEGAGAGGGPSLSYVMSGMFGEEHEEEYSEAPHITPAAPGSEAAVVEAMLRALLVELQNPESTLEDGERVLGFFTKKDIFKAATYPLVTLLMFMANISFLQGSKDALPGYPLIALSFGISGMTDSSLCGLWTGTVLDDMLADALFDANDSVRAVFSNLKKDWRHYLRSGAILGTGLVSAFPLGALTWNKIQGVVKKPTTSAISFLGEASLTVYSAQQEMTGARFQVRLSAEERAMLSSAKAFLLEIMCEARADFLTSWNIKNEELTLEDVFSILNSTESAEAPSNGQGIAVGTVKKGAKAGLIGYTGVTYLAVEMIVNAIFASADANPEDYLVLIQSIVLPATAWIMYYFGALMQEGAENVAKGAYKAMESLIKGDFDKFLRKNIAYQLNPRLFLAIMIPIITMGVQSGLTNKDMTQNLTPALIRHVAAIVQTIFSWFGLEILWSGSDLESSGMPSFLQKAVNGVLPIIFGSLAYGASALFNTYGALAFSNASMEASYKFRAERDPNFRPEDAPKIRQLAFWDRLIKEFEAASVDRIALLINLQRQFKDRMLFEKNINCDKWDALMAKLDAAILKAKVEGYTLRQIAHYGKAKEGVVYFDPNEKQYRFLDQLGNLHEGTLDESKLVELFGDNWQPMNLASNENAPILKEAIFRRDNEQSSVEMRKKAGDIRREVVRRKEDEAAIASLPERDRTGGYIVMHESGREKLRTSASSGEFGSGHSDSRDQFLPAPSDGSVNAGAGGKEDETLLLSGEGRRVVPEEGRCSSLLSWCASFGRRGNGAAANSSGQYVSVQGVEEIEGQADNRCCVIS